MGGGWKLCGIYKERGEHEHCDSTSRPFGSSDLTNLVGMFDV